MLNRAVGIPVAKSAFAHVDVKAGQDAKAAAKAETHHFSLATRACPALVNLNPLMP